MLIAGNDEEKRNFVYDSCKRDSAWVVIINSNEFNKLFWKYMFYKTKTWDFRNKKISKKF